MKKCSNIDVQQFLGHFLFILTAKRKLEVVFAKNYFGVWHTIFEAKTEYDIEKGAIVEYDISNSFY